MTVARRPSTPRAEESASAVAVQGYCCCSLPFLESMLNASSAEMGPPSPGREAGLAPWSHCGARGDTRGPSQADPRLGERRQPLPRRLFSGSGEDANGSEGAPFPWARAGTRDRARVGAAAGTADALCFPRVGFPAPSAVARCGATRFWVARTVQLSEPTFLVPRSRVESAASDP